ncbi:N-acetyldiaminopimelate deacetylase [Alkalihalobacillus pseudalcaliphilus]|uniref:N-acetyldiaminopimelate deacetylase n=1 Tax=Alkalihalobacillus pseudalcaliphilus TaxID=79884 RepID=UPI00064DF741|nr:N-acetyldiaminopimelate deacetylase [Alkalihalobacillus pseudalcaliphilus]KMK77045.1 N-acetyldiaminopimelate deacetylase [Alkalihalobacillus pseudalcaliphilus]
MNRPTPIEIRRELHQIPEPGFAEYKTQAYLLRYIQTLPQDLLQIKTWKTGILIFVKGSVGNRTFGYRADMDGLPIAEQTTYQSFRSQHTDYMHACGHDLHMAIALGILTQVAESQPVQNLLFIFQPAEEGPGGAMPLLQSAEFRQWKPDEIFALHIAPDYKVGEVASKPGLLFANTSELFIDLKGKGGHAAYPHTANDMVVAASHLVTQLQTIIARNIDPLDSGVVTIGVIKGGTKQNIIADSARIEGTIRSLSIESMHSIKKRIKALLKGIEVGFECDATIDYGSNYCQVYNDELLINELEQFLAKKPAIQYIQCKEAMTGEDFGYFLEDIPGFMVWLGVDSPYGLHDARIEPNEEAITVAIELFTDFFSQRL